MIVEVEGSRGNIYHVNTEEVTCDCKDFRFRCSRQPRLSEAHQCKHLRQVYSEHPEYMPDDVARAMKVLDNKIEQATNGSSSYPKAIAETYITLLQSLCTKEIVPINEVLQNVQNISMLEFVMNSKESPAADIESIDGIISLNKTAETDQYLEYEFDGILPCRIWHGSGEEFICRVLFGTESLSNMDNLVHRASQKGWVLTPRGLREASAEETPIHFSSKEELINLIMK